MYKKNALLLLIITVLSANLVEAQVNKTIIARPDAHAPIGVMGDHFHKKGEIMFSYRNMLMSMNGNLNITDKISDNNIYNKYMTAPQKMLMDMVSVMYASSNHVTMMIMVNYSLNYMNLKTKKGMSFTTKSLGFNDFF